MRTIFRTFGSKLAAGMLLSGFAVAAQAQTYPYVADFETTTPATKAYNVTTAITMNGLDWTMPGVYLGSMLTGDRYNGTRSARVRLSNNSSGTPGYLEMLADLPNGAGTFSYKAGRYASESVDSIEVYYSTNSGTNWTLVSVDPVTDTNLMTFTHNVNVGGNIRFKLAKRMTTNNRFNIDDINITQYNANPAALYITAKTPTGTGVPLATDSLTATFSQAITAGSGNLMLYKVGQASPVATFAGTAATINGNTAKFATVALENATDYYVTVDTNTFTYNGAGNVPVSGTTAWTFSTEDTTPQAPVITYRIPYGTNVNPLTDSIRITFSEDITGGAGNVSLYKVGQAAPVATFAGTSATINGDMATFMPIMLEAATDYYVMVDANTVYNSTVPNDTASWTFSTMDTSYLTTLSESFANCVSSAIGAFSRYSVSGNKTWNCSSYGHNDTDAVYINGGFSSGSEENNDWLISSRKLDFSAMSNPELSFWQKRRYDGDVTRKILISTDYAGAGDPTAATWTDLNVVALSMAPDSNTWAQIKDISLESYKNTPFYLAFTYECGTTGAYELTYDDIMVEDNTTGIQTVKGASLDLQVLGMPTSNTINLNVELKNNDQLEISVYDLIGRKVASRQYAAQSGTNRIQLNNLNLSSGMYVIHVAGKKGFGTIKAAVR